MKQQCHALLLACIGIINVISAEIQLNFLPAKENTHLSYQFLKKLADCFTIKTFVETGTFMGDSTAIAAQIFDTVHTIELSNELYKKAQQRFAHSQNVYLHHGDSSVLLPEVLAITNDTTLFWLDGHFSKGNTALGKKNTPILEELQAIREAGVSDAVILIDDIRCFQNTQPYPDKALEGYPTFQELYYMLQTIEPSYVCYVIGDVALAWPTAHYDITPCRLIQACTASRIYTQDNAFFDEILSIEECIAQAATQEQHMLMESTKNFTGYGSGYYHLWTGLIAEANKEYAAALSAYTNAEHHGTIDWRPQFYKARLMAKMHNYEDALTFLAPLTKYVTPCNAVTTLHTQCTQAIQELKKTALQALLLPARQKNIGYNDCRMTENGEQFVLSKLIHTGDTVFDVGANVGEWSKHVLSIRKQVNLHAFEPISSVSQNLYTILDNDHVHTIALSNTVGIKTLYCYANNRLSSLYERKSVNLHQAQTLTVYADTLCNVCSRYGIDTINYLKIDTEGAELSVLQGAQALINRHAIDLIQFEYGGTYRDAGITLRQVYDLLTQAGYAVTRIVPNGLEPITTWSDELECYQYSNYLAIAPQLNPRF